MQVAPTDAVSAGLMFFKFGLDHPESAGPGVTDDDVAFETDVYVDWE